MAADPYCYFTTLTHMSPGSCSCKPTPLHSYSLPKHDHQAHPVPWEAPFPQLILGQSGTGLEQPGWEDSDYSEYSTPQNAPQNQLVKILKKERGILFDILKQVRKQQTPQMWQRYTADGSMAPA